MDNIVNMIDRFYDKCLFQPITKYITHPFMRTFERFIWNPINKHWKITFTVMGLILIWPFVHDFFF